MPFFARFSALLLLLLSWLLLPVPEVLAAHSSGMSKSGAARPALSAISAMAARADTCAAATEARPSHRVSVPPGSSQLTFMLRSYF